MFYSRLIRRLHLFQRPLLDVNLVRENLDVAFVTANKLVDQLEALGLLEEITGRHRFRIFRYTPYLMLFEEREPLPDQDVPVQTTETEG